MDGVSQVVQAAALPLLQKPMNDSYCRECNRYHPIYHTRG